MTTLAAIVVSVGLLGAPAADRSPDAIAEPNLDSIARSLERISRTLDALLAEQRVEVVLRRIEVEARRLEPLEQELRGARDELRGGRANVEQIRAMLEDLEERIDDAVRAGADPASVPERDERKNFEAMLAFEESRLEEAERRVLELEQDLDRGRDRIRILDETLGELLGAD